MIKIIYRCRYLEHVSVFHLHVGACGTLTNIGIEKAAIFRNFSGHSSTCHLPEAYFIIGYFPLDIIIV